MTTPITLADLRELARTERLGMLDCRRYVDQLLAAPERVKVTERWEVRVVAGDCAPVTRSHKSQDHARADALQVRSGWAYLGLDKRHECRARVVHVTTYQVGS